MGLMTTPDKRLRKEYEVGALASWHHEDKGTATTDQSLMQRLVAKDETALAILYDRYAEMVHSTVRSILTEEGAAEEIVPEIFYQIWMKASDFKPARSTVPGYILVTARKCAVHRLLCRGFENSERLGADPSISFSNPGLQLTQEELMARVKSILAEMPHSQRVPLQLAHSKDAVQAARYSGRLIDAVKTRMRAALKVLREMPAGDLNPYDRNEQGK
jgi:RNA polymerase sigma-70 factor, ECF subfamily